MHGLRQLREALRYLWPFNDPFEDGVALATANKTFYIDPNVLNDPDRIKNIARLEGALAEQGLGAKQEILEELLDKSLTGPYVQKFKMEDGTIGAVITKPHAELVDKNKLIFIATDVPIEKLRRIPGENNIWQKFLGAHEGGHLDQDAIFLPFDSYEKHRKAIQFEVDSDRLGIAYLRELGREDMIQAWKDYRALGMRTKKHHATSLFLDEDGPTVVTEAHVLAIRDFEEEMNKAVAQELQVDLKKVLKIFENDPEKYIDTVDELLARGEIGSTPEITAYIKDYAGAYRRQILEAYLDPAVPRVDHWKDHDLPDDLKHWSEMRNMEPSVNGKLRIAENSEQYEMKIDGVKPAEYFARYAAPTEEAASAGLAGPQFHIGADRAFKA